MFHLIHKNGETTLFLPENAKKQTKKRDAITVTNFMTFFFNVAVSIIAMIFVAHIYLK